MSWRNRPQRKISSALPFTKQGSTAISLRNFDLRKPVCWSRWDTPPACALYSMHLTAAIDRHPYPARRH